MSELSSSCPPKKDEALLLCDPSAFVFRKIKCNNCQIYFKRAVFNLYPLAILLQVRRIIDFSYRSENLGVVYSYLIQSYLPLFSKCTYCNFNKYVDPNVDNDRMEKSLVRELSTELAHWGLNQKSRPIRSVYFGGKYHLFPSSVIFLRNCKTFSD